MSRVAYVNGAYVPLRAASVSIQDRGFQFGDAIYEVWALRGGRLFDADAHMARLERSLAELRLALPIGPAALRMVMRETARRNRVRDGVIYVQVSRGAAARDHVFPAGVSPTLVVTAKSIDLAAQAARAETGVRVVSFRDTRWARRDIKSVNLLPNVLARQAAREAGAFEAWFVDPQGFVTEGTSSTAWIVDGEGRLRTRPLSHALLHGITRATVLGLARERQLPVHETPFTIAEAQAAREAFLTSAGNAVLPVIAVDGADIGDGRPGSVTRALRAAYLGESGTD